MPLADINRITLHYRMDGPGYGPVVILSNSLAADLTMWDLQVPVLIRAGYQVLRYDTRGHGRSAVPEGPYTLEMLAADIIGLMDFIGLERAHFCGLSMGGMAGQMLAARYGSRLDSLFISSTAAYIPPRELWDERIESVREKGMPAVADATIERWFTSPGRERLAAEVGRIRKVILATSAEGYCACCAAIRDMDLREMIRSIENRTLIVVGEQDQGTPVSSAESIHRSIPFSDLRVIPGAAHFVNVEQARMFNDILLGFLQGKL
jgi:3-oxoadipate enol-lactonase